MAAGRSEAGAKLDIGIFIALLPPEHHGGAELQADRLARELVSRGHRVQVFARRQPGRSRSEERDGVLVHRRRVLPVPGLRGAVDIVLGVVQAVRARPRLLLCYMTFNNGLMGAAAGALLRVPFVIWQRLEGESLLGVSALHRRTAFALERRAARVWVQAPAFMATLERAYRRAGSDAAWQRLRPRLRVVGNGMDMPADSGPGAPPPWRALFVGRLTPQKDLPTLLAAARRVPECEIWVVGDGPLRAVLEREAPPSVRFLGVQPHARVAQLLRESRALVLCSTTEGVPNVVLESLAHSRPVVATPVGATPQFVHDGENGWLVPVGDVEALAAALRDLRDDAAWCRRAAVAREAVRGCDWGTVAARVEAELESIRSGERAADAGARS